ncbi:hypothetical protein SPRG_13478 [Saprolegnia parasitica CBS 223.65]|uniref:Centrosomal protein of 19 kDa n=1 Tax=Saprolegnia parasitica (strain CBS 223.65) TaxID=695850 RepID=A0A067BQ02_SAPPC|nr:hypothetical protein SPRG_13478 [Saprolegnia parasitica CBS 223.65]KDO20333.1 hypothetical protein SPRG_13478 [Saprolegnia parasitica CBS 223.65]|eukprot:XP_012208931.1 hypothetical protein SPRG_13478 [Saprolegnia parasitica CBS 223.65]
MEPRRVGLRVSPPLLTLEYTAGDGALYHHEVPLASYLARSSDAGQIALAITDEHRAYFAQVAPAQLRRLLERLVSPTKVETRNALPAADYNKVSESQLAAVKAKMDTVFHEHLCKPGDPGYVYNKEVTFGAATAASDWDDE